MKRLILGAVIAAAFIVGVGLVTRAEACGGPCPTATPATPTKVPATSTSVPATPTVVVPTATSVPPTSTTVPNTPVPPTPIVITSSQRMDCDFVNGLMITTTNGVVTAVWPDVRCVTRVVQAAPVFVPLALPAPVVVTRDVVSFIPAPAIRPPSTGSAGLLP